MDHATDTASPEIKAVALFEAYKDANDERLAQIERRQQADVLTEEKLARIERRLDETLTRSRRPQLGGEVADCAAIEHKAAFDAYIRSGQADRLRMIETKAQGAVGPDTGYLVPPDAEQAILARIAALSPIRALATVRALATASLKKAVSPSGPTGLWVTQTTPSSTVDPNALAELNFPTMELYAQPAATQAMLDDPAVDIESWIASEIELAFAEAESAAFVSGDGVHRPKGFLTYPTVADSAWSWGSIGTIATGVSANFPAANASDILVDLAYTLRPGYRQNAVFVMNRKTQSAIRKFKDANGNYLWAPPTTIGAKPTLMNFPVVELEAMPDIAANALAVAFGDFRRGYLVADRIGIRALRDPYSAKPYVLFYTTKRVGGGVQDFEAIKFLRFGT